MTTMDTTELITMDSTTILPYNMSNVSESCADTVVVVQLIWIGANIPLTIILLLVGTCCRCQLKPFKCCTRPKLVYPMNFLDGYTNRLAYAFGFLVTSNVILDLLQLSASDQPYLSQFSATIQFFLWAFIKYIFIIICALVFYPLLMSITYSNGVTDILGFIFTSNWFAMYIVIYTICPIGSLQGLITGLGYAPALISCVGLIIFFVWRLAKRCHYMCSKTTTQSFERDDKFQQTHFYQRVQHLLMPADKWKSFQQPRGRLQKVIRLIYPPFPGFKYSTRVVCTVTLSVIVLYQISLLYITSMLVIVQELVRSYLVYSPELSFIIKVSFNLSSYPAVFISFINCLLFLRNYRENTRELWKGHRSRFDQAPIAPHSVIIACLSFSSLSIAYTAWGFLVLQILLWFVMCVVVFIFRLHLVVGLLQSYWFYLFGIILFIMIQQILARFVLLHRKSNGALVIDNRHFFHIVVHFFFFLNIIVGLVGSLLRIIRVAVVGVVLIGRVDLCLAPRGFENFDKGFGAYRAFLELEVSMTHPVVVTFCHLLNRSRRKTINYDEPHHDVEKQNTQVVPEGEIEIKDVASFTKGRKDKSSSRRLRNRWFKAVTLIRNKRLVYEILHKLEGTQDGVQIVSSSATQEPMSV